MATVRFSEELKNSILNTASALYEDRSNAAESNHPSTWGDTVYNLMFKDTSVQMEALPRGYFSEIESITLAGFKGDGWDTNINCSPNRLALSRKRRTPVDIQRLDESQPRHGLVDRGRGGHGSYGGYILDATDPRWGAFKAEYLTYCTAIKAIDTECRAFADGVRAVVNTYTTLAPALKAWPALWDLLPPGAKSRHKEIRERQKRELAPVGVLDEAGVDLSKMTAAVTLNKLTR